MTATHEIALPAIVRALNIYGAVSKHGADRETRQKLAKHIVRLCDWGERDQNRLTVHGSELSPRAGYCTTVLKARAAIASKAARYLLDHEPDSRA